MKVVKSDELVQYNPKGHFKCLARRAHSNELTDTRYLTIGLSKFEPQGGAEASPVADGMELVYYIVENEMTITCEGSEVTLKAGDSVAFKSGEVRSAINNSDKDSYMLVIAAKDSQA